MNMITIKRKLQSEDFGEAAYLLMAEIVRGIDNGKIRERIWNYISKVEFVDDKRTCCVNLETGVIAFGVAFFIKWIASFEDLLFLMLHERNHIILKFIFPNSIGKLYRLLPFDWANLCEDSYINGIVSHLCSSKITSRFYKPKGATALLRSPVGENRTVSKFYTKVIASFHRSIWKFRSPKDMPSFERYVSAFIDWYRSNLPETSANYVELVSRPSNEELDLKEKKSGQFESEKREEVDVDVDVDINACMNPEVLDEKATLSDIQKKSILYVPPNSALSRAIDSVRSTELLAFDLSQEMTASQLLKLPNVQSMINNIESLKLADNGSVMGYLPVPTSVSKRDVMTMVMGGQPVMWGTKMESPDSKKIKLYMDVSSSMGAFVGLIPYFFHNLIHYVDEFFEFSTLLVKVDPQDKFYYGTGGTSYNEVGKHMVETGCREAIVISDGTEPMKSEIFDTLKEQLRYLYYIRLEISSTRVADPWMELANLHGSPVIRISMG